MKEQLLKAKNLVEFVDTLTNYYDLRGCRPTKLILQILVSAIKAAIDIQDKELVEAALKSLTLYDFLMLFAQYYDSINKVFKPEHKEKFINRNSQIVTLTKPRKIS